MGTESSPASEAACKGGPGAGPTGPSGSATVAPYSDKRATGVLLAAGGMAAQWACLHTVTFPSTVFDCGELPASVWTVNTLTTFVIFLAGFFFWRKVSALLDRRGSGAAIVGCIIGGWALLVAGDVLPAPGFAPYVGTALMSLGSTPLILKGACLYRYLDPKGEQLFVTLTAIIASVIVYLVETVMRGVVGNLVFIALPVCAVVCFRSAQRLLSAQPSDWIHQRFDVAKKSPALFYICIIVLSIPYNYSMGSVPAITSEGADAFDWVHIVAMAVLIMTLVAVAEVLAERKGFLIVPMAVLIMISATMAVGALLGDMGAQIAPYLLYPGYYLMIAMIYLAVGPTVSSGGLDPVRTFSGAMLANVGGLVAGTALGMVSGFLGETGISIMLLVIIYVILFFGFAVLSRGSYSIFRVNYFDREGLSFEYASPLVPAGDLDLGERGAMEVPELGGPSAGSRSRTDQDGFDAAGAPGEGDEVAHLIQTRCAAVSKQAGLTERETDVLLGFARGRTVASVATQLSVSENTVKAHAKSLYRKLGVHTREELFRVVENA